MDAHRSLPQPPNHWIENVHQMTSSFIFSGVTHLHENHPFFQYNCGLYSVAAIFLSPGSIFNGICCNGSIPMFDPDIISYCQAFNGCYCSIKKWICQQNGAQTRSSSGSDENQICCISGTPFSRQPMYLL